jgi:hypothetical protein
MYSLIVNIDKDAYVELQQEFISLADANREVCIPVYVDELKVFSWTKDDSIVDFDDIEADLERRIEKWDVETRRYLDQQPFTRMDSWDTFVGLVAKINEIAPRG